MDDIERAQDRAGLDTELALKAHHFRVHTPAKPLAKLIDDQAGEELCINCTEPLERERLAHNPGIRLCLACQKLADDTRSRRVFRG